MEGIAWPIAVVVIAICFMLTFRTSIQGLLGRTTKLTSKGLEADPQEQALERRAELEPDRTRISESPVHPLVEAEMSRIESLLSADPDQGQAERERKLMRAVAENNIALDFERAYGLIFGSQISALELLNDVGGTWESAARLRPLFDGATQRFGQLHSGRKFEEWLRFLLNFRLIEENAEATKIRITSAGAEFLKYLIDRRYTRHKFG